MKSKVEVGRQFETFEGEDGMWGVQDVKDRQIMKGDMGREEAEVLRGLLNQYFSLRGKLMVEGLPDVGGIALEHRHLRVTVYVLSDGEGRVSTSKKRWAVYDVVEQRYVTAGMGASEARQIAWLLNTYYDIGVLAGAFWRI